MKWWKRENPNFTEPGLHRQPPGEDFLCEWPACGEHGKYRAPVSPENLNQYRWFCLSHIREYNAQWNYFNGMTRAEIEAFRRDSLSGLRPTWPINNAHSWSRAYDDAFDDAHDLFDGVSDAFSAAKMSETCWNSAQCQALTVLELDARADLKAVKKQYKKLVKRYHPDRNGGSKRAEEALKRVTAAYAKLMAEC